MSFTGWIAVGIAVGAAISIVFDDPTIIGFGAAFGIMAGAFWGRTNRSPDDPDHH